jgi:hypothetical protein
MQLRFYQRRRKLVRRLGPWPKERAELVNNPLLHMPHAVIESVAQGHVGRRFMADPDDAIEPFSERWRSFTGLLRVPVFRGSATGIEVLLVTQLGYANGRCA